MNGRKQMCWCFKVFWCVFTNLTYRLFSEVSYEMCRCKRGPEESGDCDGAEDFYKDVGRIAAENLLKNKQDGTFIIRPSKNSNLGTLSVVQDNKVFHLNIRRREDGLVALGTEKVDEKCFRNVNTLINYYISNYLVVYSKGERFSTLLLPYRERRDRIPNVSHF